MSSITTTPTSHDAHGGGGHDGDPHGGNGHDPHLAHHFDTPEQQQASGKLGMWVFLATEILMFGGLFCAYSVYRHNHPDVFEVGHKWLDKKWGAINTVVLITSSLTMAWGVRLAQLGRQRGLIITLILTILGGYGFMAIKSVEYKTKWDHGLGVATANMYRPIKDSDPLWTPGSGTPASGKPAGHDVHGGAAGAAAADAHKPEGGVAAAVHHDAPKADGATPATATPPAAHDEHKTAGDHGAAAKAAPVVASSGYVDPNAGTPDAAAIKPVAMGPAGLAPKVVEEHNLQRTPEELEAEYDTLSRLDKERTYTFFQVYFLMTGLHGIHVVVGMALIYWILLRAVPPSAKKTVKVAGVLSVGLFLIYVGVLVHSGGTTWTGVVVCGLAALGMLLMKGPAAVAPALAGAADVGEFSPAYFAPVDIVGLYWHLVDLIWIFLFPLLYLIH